jgi:hypothetical protein
MTDCAKFCPDNFQIESFYSKTDCLGNDFSIGFSNKMRLYGSFGMISQPQDTKERGESQFVYDRRLMEVWRLVLTQPLVAGSFLFERFTKSVLLGRNITLYFPDKIESGFIFKGNIDKNPSSVIQNQWYITVELEREVCRLNDVC